MITRILAAVVGLLVIVPVFVYGGPIGLDVIVAIVLLICLDEYARMAFPDDHLPALAWLVLAGGGVFAGTVYGPAAWLLPTWATALVATAIFVVLRPLDIPGAADRLGRHLVGLAWIAGLLSVVPLLRRLDHGLAWVFLVLAIAWAGDTFAYFAGRFFGRHKLYERVSPKKTWEGFVGGLVGSIAAVLVARAVALDGLGVAESIGLGAVLGSVGVLGDLSESLLKRSFGVKDSGSIMPGHGGLLDRIDSVLFVVPLLFAYVSLAHGSPA